jgi:hypothetical protein
VRRSTSERKIKGKEKVNLLPAQEQGGKERSSSEALRLTWRWRSALKTAVTGEEAKVAGEEDEQRRKNRGRQVVQRQRRRCRGSLRGGARWRCRGSPPETGAQAMNSDGDGLKEARVL